MVAPNGLQAGRRIQPVRAPETVFRALYAVAVLHHGAVVTLVGR